MNKNPATPFFPYLPYKLPMGNVWAKLENSVAFSKSVTAEKQKNTVSQIPTFLRKNTKK